MPDNIQQQMNAAYAAMNGQPAPAATVQPTVQPVQAAPVQPAVQPAPVYQQPVQYVQAAAPQFAMPPAQPQAAAWGQPQQALPNPVTWSVPVVRTIEGEEVTIYVNFPAETLMNADAIILAMASQGHRIKRYAAKQPNAWSKGSSYGSGYRKGGW